MQSETARIEAFSDGVFAIAITLLILELKVPPRTGVGLARALAAGWPSYVSFLVSFAFIGIMWVNHHRLFNHIHRCDNGLMFVNLLLLLGVSVVPFPTAVLASYLGGKDALTAALLFHGTYVVIAIFFNLLWHHARRHYLLDKSVDPASADGITRQYAFGPLMYFACFALAFVSVRWSVVANAALAVFFALPPKMATRSPVHANRAA